jgi:hypothetical protein
MRVRSSRNDNYLHALAIAEGRIEEEAKSAEDRELDRQFAEWTADTARRIALEGEGQL